MRLVRSGQEAPSVWLCCGGSSPSDAQSAMKKSKPETIGDGGQGARLELGRVLLDR